MDQRRPHYYNNSFLTKGSQVEVSSDEDGLNGGWFVATVIHPPPSISTTKKNKSLNHHTRNNNLVYVEYQNLSSEDGSSRRLREYANVSYVRPSPQLDTSAAAPEFQLNDLVDAFYRDGWWTGVITAVVDSSNFVVTFQNPPDQIQFHSSALRVHRRWDGGRWVQPEIQRTAGLMFTAGKKVEVCLEGEAVRDVWFPATVVENLGNNSFLVEYEQQQQQGIGAAALRKVSVDYLHIRPTPPHLRDKNFVVLEKVDAYYDFGWWSGVITKEVGDNRYKVLLNHTKEEREFVCSRVRPHMEWTGGKWFTTSQRSKRGGKSVEVKTPNSTIQEENLETEHNRSEGAKGDGPVQENVEKDVTIDNGMKLEQMSDPNVAQVVLVIDKEGKEGGGESVAATPRRKRGRPPKLQTISPPETPIAGAVNGGLLPEMEMEMEMEDDGAQRSASSGTKPLEQAKGGDNENIQTSSHVMMEVVPKESGANVNVGKKYSSMKGKRGKRRTISINSESPTPTEAPKETAEKDDAGVDSPTPTTNVDNLPLSMQSPVTSIHGTETEEQASEERQSASSNTAIILSAAAAADEKKLPFVISTPIIWKTIESMEAFRKIPQKPHFGPLEGVKESVREGLAIGSMVTFTTVVDKTCALRLEDPRSALHDCLEALVELEAHGFQVELIQDRLAQLLLLKDKQEELQQRSQGIAQQLEDLKTQRDAMDTQIGEIDRELMALQERRSQLLSHKEQSVMGATKAAGDHIHQQLMEVGREFHGLAAAPFL